MPNLTPPPISSSRPPVAPIGGGEARLTSREVAEVRLLLDITRIMRTAIQNERAQTGNEESPLTLAEVAEIRSLLNITRIARTAIQNEGTQFMPEASVAQLRPLFNEETAMREATQTSLGIDNAMEEPSFPLTTPWNPLTMGAIPRPAANVFARAAQEAGDVFQPPRQDNVGGRQPLPIPTRGLDPRLGVPTQPTQAFPMSPLAIRSWVFLKKLCPTYPMIIFKGNLPFIRQGEDPNIETPAKRLTSILFKDDFLDTFQLVGCCEQGGVDHANSFQHLSAMAAVIKSLTDETVQSNHPQRACMLCKAWVSGDQNEVVHVEGARHRHKKEALRLTRLTPSVIREEATASAEIDRWLSSLGN